MKLAQSLEEHIKSNQNPMPKVASVYISIIGQVIVALIASAFFCISNLNALHSHFCIRI